MDQTQTPEWYTVAEVAERMRVSKMSIYRMCNRGDLPGAMRFGSRTFRIKSVVFDLWIAESTEPSAYPMAAPGELDDDQAVADDQPTLETA